MWSLYKIVATTALLALLAMLSCVRSAVHAQEAAFTIHISVKDHRFQPATLQAPANKPIVLIIKNLDSTPMEFESVRLRVEKVVAGGGEGIIRLRALEAGAYNFFDDFHQQTQGTLDVK
jgi:hypothetical protein